MTKYGEDLSVVAIFSEIEIMYGDSKIPAKSLLIMDGDRESRYKPEVKSTN